MAGLNVTCLECEQVNRVPQDRLASGPKCASCGARLLSDKAKEISLSTLQKAARNDDLPLVVDFWAPWCGPCRSMAPEFSKAAQTLKGQARLVKVNTEANTNATRRYDIRGIPTMIKFKGGREVKRQPGALRLPQIVAWAK